MKGIFVFDDLHAEVRLRAKRQGRFLVRLHIAMTCHRIDICAPPSKYNPLNGVAITPERPVDRGIPFLVFADLLDFPHQGGDSIIVDVQEQEVFWRPEKSDLVALAIADSFKDWDGQDLRELRDDFTRSHIAYYLDRLAAAAGISSFFRSSGEPVLYQQYLA